MKTSLQQAGALSAQTSDSARPAPATPCRIAVIGAGHVGLVTATCLASLGHHVVAVDSDVAKVRALQRGAVPIYEPDLHALITDARAAGRLSFEHGLMRAVHHVDVIFMAVGTPARVDGAADVRGIGEAIGQLAALLRCPATLVIKSTVPVGSTDLFAARVASILEGRKLRWKVPVISNPEFLREGNATRDFLCPERILVGARSDEDAEPLRRVYAPLVERGVPFIRMSTRSAELSKYAANAMLATRISFMNEMAGLADATGADIDEVRLGIGSDSRIGNAFLRPGVGYGGSCFPKDVGSLRQAAAARGVSAPLLAAVQQTNERQKRLLMRKMLEFYGGSHILRGRRVALWGLAFKPGTDDMREAPSLVLITQLLAAGCKVSAYDPAALENAAALFGTPAGLSWCGTALAALDQADALVLLTEWDEFQQFSPQVVAGQLRDRVVFDGRNALDARAWSACGLQVVQIGRPVQVALDSPRLHAMARPPSSVPPVVVAPACPRSIEAS